MLFNSADFLIFFPIVFSLYLIMPKKLRAPWLLICSYYFYMCWNARYIVLILFTTLITYLAGLFIEKSDRPQRKRFFLVLAIALNLAVLFIFKYSDFAVQNINALLSLFHVQAIENPFDVLLPVGISFYTFQTFSYVIDVYQGKTKAEHSFLYYALFASFFPQLVAGPIERSNHLLSQLRSLAYEKKVTFEKASSGFVMMLYGLFMKMVIADRISIFVDGVWDNLFACGSVETIFAAFGFAIQIYCDFGGYSAIAIGASRIMGIELTENFNTPYFARSISEFWRRWHVSLSSWLRDYIYIPLGGNRCSRKRKYANIMITFLASGLWHGASWTYVFWGALHGCFQIAGDLLSPVKERLWGGEKGKAKKASFQKPLLRVNTGAFSFRLGQVACTFILTTFAWIFFRAGTMGQALYFLNRMFTRINPWVLFNDGLYEFGLSEKEFFLFFAFLLLLFAADLLRYIKGVDLGNFLITQNLLFRWIILLFFIVVIFVYGEYGIDFDSGQFIYFAF